MSSKYKLVWVSLFALFLTGSSLAQDEFSDIELFLIDSYVTQEKPHIFKLTFFTTESVKSEIILDGNLEYVVSGTLAEDHKGEFDVTSQSFSSSTVVMNITLTTENGTEIVKGPYEIILPQLEALIETDQDLNLLTVCCFGGVIFGLPAPTAIFFEGETKWALSKEIPLLSYYTSGFNYPAHYLSLEYQYINDVENNHLYRVGYKYIKTLPVIEYLSGGVNLYSDFKGHNGLSPEFTIGIYKFYNVFTIYSRYRYNFEFNNSDNKFHELSIGLYSNFFSLNL